MARTERHPSLTPTRALNLLENVDRAIGGENIGVRGAVLRDVAEALRDHVRHGLAQKRRRRRG